MKEIQEILKKISQFGEGEKAILATVIDVVGSGYRRPGARMLIDENGYSIGTVSGGCLEADVLERAKKVLETNQPIVITYDTTKDETSVFGLSMGCRGIVRILLEKVSDDNIYFDFLRGVFDERKNFTMATLISSNIENFNVGMRVFRQDSKITVNGLTPHIPDNLLTRIKQISTEKLPEIETFDFGEVFFETINPPLNLLLFGAGYDALPLIDFAKEIGWRVTAIDHRAAFANKERLTKADEIIVSNSEDLPDEIFCRRNQRRRRDDTQLRPRPRDFAAFDEIQMSIYWCARTEKAHGKTCWRKSAKNLMKRSLPNSTRPSVWTSVRTRRKQSRFRSSPK